MNVHESPFGWIFPEIQKSRFPEICKSGNIYLEKSLLHRIYMPSCVGLNPSARKVMRFLEVGSRCPPEASHGRQQRLLIPEDLRNIAAENPPEIFLFWSCFFGRGIVLCGYRNCTRRLTGARCTFVRQPAVCPTKVLALRGGRCSPKSNPKSSIE